MQRLITNFVSLLFLLIPFTEALAAPQGSLDHLKIEGTWRPRAAVANPERRIDASPAGFEAAWDIAKDRILLAMPEKNTAAYEIVRAEPLPQGDWTLDFWTVHHDSNRNADVTFFVGDKAAADNCLSVRVHPGMDYADVDVVLAQAGARESDFTTNHYRAGAGPIQWMRIVHSKQLGRLLLFLNGEPIFWDKEFAPLVTTPVGFRINAHYKQDEKTVVEIASFQVSATALIEPPAAPGRAFKGWQKAVRPEPLPAPLAAELNTRVQALLDAPELSPQGRASALAALLLAERAAQGKLSPARWDQVANFVDKRIDLDLAGLSVLLPLAIATADVADDANRRQKAEVWVRRFFEALPPRDGAIAGGTDVILKRASLLDPMRAAQAVLPRRPSLPMVRALAPELQEAAPLQAFALYRTFERSFASADVWLLPETGAIIPVWKQLLVRLLLEKAKQKPDPYVQWDHDLSFGAYRLAPTDLPAALELIGQLKKPDIKAETLEAIAAQLMTGAEDVKVDGKTAGGGAFDVAIENALKAAVAQWQPARRVDSPVPQIIRLAQWYASKGRRADALTTLTQALPKVNPEPGTLFRDTWAIARLMRDLKLPESTTWWDKAKAAAVAKDTARDEPDQGGGTIYLSATTLVVGELVKDGKIEEALALTQKLDPDLLEMNYSINMSRIINAIADTNFTRALELAQQVPAGERRNRVLGNLAVKRAAKDVPAALAMLEELPAAARTDVALRMAEFVPLEKAPAVRQVTGEAISAHLKEWAKVRNYRTHGQLTEIMADLPLPSLLLLEPYFQDDRDFYAGQLLAAVVRVSGLADDPIWRRFSDTGASGGWRIPWSVGRLKDALQAEEANLAQG